MRSPVRLTAPALLLAFAACAPTAGGPSDVAPAAKTHEAITYGTPDTTHQAVVALLMDEGTGFAACSGTIIRINASLAYVLTAGHCVYNFTQQQFLAPAKVYVVVGNDYADTATRVVYASTSVVAHPSYSHDASQPDDAYDVAVVGFDTLGAPLPTIRAATSAADDTLSAGAAVEFVGYGRTEQDLTTGGHNSTRNHVTSHVNNLGDHVGQNTAYQFTSLINFATPQGGTCRGDSGGPALVTKNGELVVVGTTSYGDTNCTIAGVDVRVSGHYASFIGPAIGDNAAGGAVGASGAAPTCESQFPGGRARFDQIVAACACLPGGRCVSSCEADCKGLPMPGDSCFQCVNQPSDPCGSAACVQDPACAAYAACLSPSTGQGTAGQGGATGQGGGSHGGAGQSSGQGGAGGDCSTSPGQGGAAGAAGTAPAQGGAAGAAGTAPVQGGASGRQGGESAGAGGAPSVVGSGGSDSTERGGASGGSTVASGHSGNAAAHGGASGHGGATPSGLGQGGTAAPETSGGAPEDKNGDALPSIGAPPPLSSDASAPAGSAPSAGASCSVKTTQNRRGATSPLALLGLGAFFVSRRRSRRLRERGGYARSSVSTASAQRQRHERVVVCDTPRLV